MLPQPFEIWNPRSCQIHCAKVENSSPLIGGYSLRAWHVWHASEFSGKETSLRAEAGIFTHSQRNQKKRLHMMAAWKVAFCFIQKKVQNCGYLTGSLTGSLTGYGSRMGYHSQMADRSSAFNGVKIEIIQVSSFEPYTRNMRIDQINSNHASPRFYLRSAWDHKQVRLWQNILRYSKVDCSNPPFSFI